MKGALSYANSGALAQSRANVDRLISDADMAWLLVDAAQSCLTGHERTLVFVELGCGEGYLAIQRILTAVMSSQMALPVEIFSTITGWLRGYAGSPEEPRLHRILAEICVRQLEALSPRAHTNPRPRDVGGADTTIAARLGAAAGVCA